MPDDRVAELESKVLRQAQQIEQLESKVSALKTELDCEILDRLAPLVKDKTASSRQVLKFSEVFTRTCVRTRTPVEMPKALSDTLAMAEFYELPFKEQLDVFARALGGESLQGHRLSPEELSAKMNEFLDTLDEMSEGSDEDNP